MKKIFLLGFVLLSMSIYAQNGYPIIVDGKEVFIKDDGSSNVIPSATTATVAAPNYHGAKSGVHIVKKGENLYSISRLYNLTVNELCDMNAITKDSKLVIDQSLKIVSFIKSNSNYSDASFHIVVKGDTLYNISKRYGVSVAHLKELNNLSDNIISINQRLRVN